MWGYDPSIAAFSIAELIEAVGERIAPCPIQLGFVWIRRITLIAAILSFH